MMRGFLLALLMGSLSACAAVPQQPDTPLYDTFNRYRAAIVDGSIVVRRAEFFAPEVLKEIDITSDEEASALKQGTRIVDERSHHEKVDKSHGCLTVNGYGRNGHPVSLFLDYKRSDDGKWLTTFTRVYVPQPDVFKGFFEEALCPNEAHERAMQEFQQGK
jgi:hypothetical protein